MAKDYRKTPFCTGLVPSEINSFQKNRFRTGFTLVEILISSAIIALVLGGVYGVLASGIRVWKEGSRSGSAERRERFFLERLSRELRDTFPLTTIPLKGAEDSLAFAALEDKGIVRVSYFVNMENFLCRRLQSYAQSYKKEDEFEYVKLIPGVLALKFSYCYLDNGSGDYKWKDKWKPEEQDSLPRAVKVELELKRESEPAVKFAKTILIPAGTGEQRIQLGS